MALPIIGAAFKIIKNIIAPKVAQVLDFSKPYSKDEIVDLVLSKAQELVEKDKEVELALIEQEKALQGTYAELKTTFEKVVRSIVRPVVTLTFVALDAWTIISKQPFTKELWILSLVTIGSWFGQKLFTNVKDALGGNNAR